MNVVVTVIVIVLIAAGIYGGIKSVGFATRSLTRRSGPFGPFTDDQGPPRKVEQSDTMQE